MASSGLSAITLTVGSRYVFLTRESTGAGFVVISAKQFRDKRSINKRERYLDKFTFP